MSEQAAQPIRLARQNRQRLSIVVVGASHCFGNRPQRLTITTAGVNAVGQPDVSGHLFLGLCTAF
jgi:hypothetical protein